MGLRIIAGPCQHETLEDSIYIAKHCANICAMHGIEYIFKASYDKANRSSLHGKRGIGIVKTMKDFAYMKQQIDGLKILTDVHNVYEVHYVDRSEVVDVIQIPAFLCRQTDLVQAACRTGKIVNIKKGQFLAPWDITGVQSKIAGAKEVWLTERGTTFGYNNVVVDYAGLSYMLDNYPNIVFDVTHSNNGHREYIPGLARAASALGVQNFFLEVHTDPDNAPSDGPNMLALEDFETVVSQIVKYNYVSR